MDPNRPDIRPSTRPAWHWLRNLVAYRLCLATLLALLPVVGTTGLLEIPHLADYRWISLGYVGFGILTALLYVTRKPDFEIQVTGQIFIDLFALTTMMYASGGISSGLGVLLVVTVAAGSLLLPGRIAFLFAALATLCVLVSEGFIALSTLNISAAELMRAGLLGTAFFMTALLAHLLAKRIQESETLAEQRGVDLANLTQLNEYIIQHLQAGILVVDDRMRIRLVNDTGRQMLGIEPDPTGSSLEAASPELSRHLIRWQRDPRAEIGPIKPAGQGGGIAPGFRALNPDNDQATLILLEDAGLQARAAQQEKLAALGRLTAGIAHEIRNPLGAISHAAQLLSETVVADGECQRMTGIIEDQSQRVNAIVENILKLSRRQIAAPEPVHLHRWLEQFMHEFRTMNPQLAGDISVAAGPDITVLFDPGQLRQVMDNLWQNAFIHSSTDRETTRLIIETGTSGQGRGWLTVCDNGGGIDPKEADNIFEPFHSSRSRGTGLGLYIARELCEHNRARLSLVESDHDGACFRIDFSGPSQ